MSQKELEDHGLFLPESERGELDLHTSVNVPALVGTFVLGGLSCVLMATGGGGPWTWVGAGLFIAFMVLFTLVSSAGIERQNARIEQLHAEHFPNPEAKDRQQ